MGAKINKRWPSSLLLLGLLSVAGVFGVVVYPQDQDAKSRIFHRVEDLPQREWGIVLGAKVIGESPSPMLEDRLLTAAELFTSGKVHRLFLSGGPSNKGLHEVTLMAAWLVGHGVPSAALVQDPDGLRTMSSLLNAREKLDTIAPIIVTQHFHLPRALYLAKHLGFDAIGMVADHRTYLDEYCYRLREMFAQVKAAMDVAAPAIRDRIGDYLFSADHKRFGPGKAGS